MRRAFLLGVAQHDVVDDLDDSFSDLGALVDGVLLPVVYLLLRQIIAPCRGIRLYLIN